MRVHVEVEWLIYLTDQAILPGVRPLSGDERTRLRAVVTSFDSQAVAELAAIERETVHDVKAVEYYLRRRLPDIIDDADPGRPGDAARLGELLHFACTSEDINNTSYALMIRGAIVEVWAPAAGALADQVADLARQHADVPMLAHTHGQPATPTTLGKEYAVSAHRLRRQLRRVTACEYLGKFNGRRGPTGRTRPPYRGLTGRRSVAASWSIWAWCGTR
jgi:adenylosuccinate lyase